MPATKKYKLFAASDGEKQVCAFFASPAGCRNGDKCKFLHSTEKQSSAKQTIVAEVSETGSVISSESEGETMDFVSPPASIEKPKVKVEAEKTKQQPKKKNKRKSASSSDTADNLFANPRGKSNTSAVTKKANNTNSPNKKQKTSNGGSSNSKSQTTKGASTSSQAPGFRNLISSLPVASFSIPEDPKIEKMETRTSPAAKTSSESSSSSPPEWYDDLVLPKNTETGRKWMKAVQKSREHERYKNAFDFVRHKELEKEKGIPSDWIKAKPFGPWCKSNPQAIAIDCEMCETQDPLSGAKNPKALCRISVVNAENPEEVLLDTLVKPSWPVIDYRSWINGIKKEHLDRVEFTLRHAQAFMMALCSEETVIVGHAVQNDLAALNMEHHCNADSSFLYFAKGTTTSQVSLKDLVQNIFQKPMPETHDSVNDARKALECYLHWVERDGNVEEIERTQRRTATNPLASSQLFVHRIPKVCKPENLSSMIVKHTDIQPITVDPIEFTGTFGRTLVTFKSGRHCRLAFETLEGTAEEDPSGRSQKKVYLRDGGHIKVRKMVHDFANRTPNKKN